MQSKSKRFLILLAIVSATADQAFAYLAWNPTKAVQSENGQFVLVLLAPEDERTREIDFSRQDFDAESEWLAAVARRQRELELERKYARSGLYRNDGGDKLLWPIDHTGVFTDVLVSNDGRHAIIAFQDWDSSVSNRGSALSFYVDGKLSAEYGEWEFLPAFGLRVLASRHLHQEFPYGRAIAFDDEQSVVSLTTNSGNILQFDVSTGRKIAPWPSWLLPVGTPLLLGTLFGYWRWKRSVRQECQTG